MDGSVMPRKLQRLVQAVLSILSQRFTGTLKVELICSEGGIQDVYIEPRRRLGDE